MFLLCKLYYLHWAQNNLRTSFLPYTACFSSLPWPSFILFIIKDYYCSCLDFNKLTLEKMSRHRIQWLLACNLLSYFVCTFKNVTEGTSCKWFKLWVELYSHYNAPLPGYLFFSISILFCMGMATIQLRLNVKVRYKRCGPGHEWWFMATLQNGDCNRW